jgi:hypothetical protein
MDWALLERCAKRVRPGQVEESYVYEIYRIETIGPEAEGAHVVRRTLVRVESVEIAKERALRVLRLARRPQATGPEVEAVRVLNGAGYEVFSANARD